MLNALERWEIKKMITKMEKEIIKEINRTRNNLSSCVCKQGYKDLISFVKKLGGKKDEWIKIVSGYKVSSISY